MPAAPPIYLTDTVTSQQYLITVDNLARITTVPVSGVPSPPESISINNTFALQSYTLSIVSGVLTTTPTSPYVSANPSQLPVYAPNGVLYAIVIDPVTGNLDVNLANVAAITCNQPISALAVQVQNRLEEGPPTGPPGTFWSYSYEILTAVEEAICDLMLLVGRPTQAVQVEMQLSPNTVWQTTPKGIFAISDIWGGPNKLKKYTLYDYDYNQPVSDSNWESDSSTNGPFSWCPVGNNLFIVYPSQAAPVTVLLDGIAYPFAENAYPPSGNEYSPFHEEINPALEMYAAHYARLKEGTAEFQASIPLYKEYLTIAKRLTQIEDRRDPAIFNTSFGASTGLQSKTGR